MAVVMVNAAVGKDGGSDGKCGGNIKDGRDSGGGNDNGKYSGGSHY
jgi:hypothetical protein